MYKPHEGFQNFRARESNPCLLFCTSTQCGTAGSGWLQSLSIISLLARLISASLAPYLRRFAEAFNTKVGDPNLRLYSERCTQLAFSGSSGQVPPGPTKSVCRHAIDQDLHHP